MTKFVYKARNNEGQAVTGLLEAPSAQEAMLQLANMQYTPISLDEQKGASKPGESAGPKNFLDIKIDTSFIAPNVKVKDVMMFCSNLSSMTGAGVPLLGAINTIADQVENKYLADTLKKVSQLISQGNSFSEALGAFPKVFSSFFVNMVRVGEMSGNLDNTLKSLATYLEKQEHMRQTIRGIMIYPAVLMVVGTGVVIMIIMFLLPQFVGIFQKAHVTLPIPTRILYGLSLFLKAYWMWVIATLLAVTTALVVSFKNEKGRAMWDRLFIKMPIVGGLIKKILVARMCRTLGIMLSSGVPLLAALKMVRQVLGNIVFKEILDEIYASAEKGEGLNKPLAARIEVPKDVSYMISVGEQSGNIGSMLSKIADFYETKVEFEIKDLVTLIEPAFIVILGIVVGIIMAAMILPLFDMVKTIENVRK